MQEQVISKMQKLIESRFKNRISLQVDDMDDAGVPLPPRDSASDMALRDVANEILKLNLILGQERERFSAKERELKVANEEINRLKSPVMRTCKTFSHHILISFLL